MRELFGDDGLRFDDNRKVISLAEKGRKYIGDNVQQHRVVCYRVDNEMIRDGMRCDFLIGVTSKDTVYLIELKGKDLKHAAEQIFTTFGALTDRLKGKIVHGRIVLSRVQRPDIRSSQVLKLQRLLASTKGTLLKKTKVFHEKIS